MLEENTGVNALAVARDFRPDLILLDVVMPKIDGGDVAAKIKADPDLQKTPIVFLTAIISKREAKSVGHIDGLPFISKPVSLEDLKSASRKTSPVPRSIEDSALPRPGPGNKFPHVFSDG